MSLVGSATWFVLLQAATGVAVGMHIYMFKAHAALGEGLQAVALMKDMRAVGLPVPAPACSLLVLAFCKADALQVQHNNSRQRLLTLCKVHIAVASQCTDHAAY